MLKLKFDADQQHQLDAIAGVIGLFDGRARLETRFALSGNGAAVSNLPEFEEDLDPQWLHVNLLEVQRRSGFDTPEYSAGLDIDDGPTLEAAGGRSHRAPSFTLEMETGTGKTYVYLRAIFELRVKYGFSKFVVVVPSVAIYEGVRKSFAIMRDHLRALYDNEPVDLIEYDGEQMGRVGSFARSPNTGILLMTLDAFNKGSNKLYKASEKLPGEWLPYEYIQNTRPIIILDEPQRMGSDTAKKAIRSLHPLVTLRFSATHRESPNLCYRLTPVEAFRRNLVKKIQVIGVSERENANAPLLEVRAVTGGKDGIRATVRAQVTRDGKTALQDITLQVGDNLGRKTGRDAYQGDGYVVEDIRVGEDGYVEFANGVVLGIKDRSGTARGAIFRAQIAQTIRYHVKTQAELQAQQIKVLSLFFIDRVASYIDDDGIVKRLFDEEYRRALADDANAAAFKPLDPEDVRIAYFAKKKKAKGDGEEVIQDANTADFKKAEQEAYQLIMRDKERLLTFEEPHCFIFAHSALREGWDNPNVFQICTLRESASEIERRQSIGRGLRLCVNQSGERVWDTEANTLTVVANESYRDFAEGLQQEYTRDGDMAPPAPKRPRDNQAKRNDTIFESGFQAFWGKLQTPLQYRISVEADRLVSDAVARLNLAEFPAPVLTIQKAKVAITESVIAVKRIYLGRKRADLQLRLLESDGTESDHVYAVSDGDDLAKKTNNVTLKRFGTIRIEAGADGPRVVFGNAEVEKLGEGDYVKFSPDVGVMRVIESRETEARQRYPLFNIVDRAARELGITRPTLSRIFRGMREDKKRNLFSNPEGFTNVFIATLRNVLADHLTERIAFEPGGVAEYGDAAALFPPNERYPQKEIVEAGSHGLYDKMQVDSGVERTFVETLSQDGQVEFYFKFPPRFRIRMPKIIGDYNPDWGIARIDVEGKPVIHKIRETKGTADIKKLRFEHEKRKIRCAQRYFAALGIDYRPISDTTQEWWKPETVVQPFGV